MNLKDDDSSQIFTTVLAYSLPLLQFFFGQLTGSIQNLFLFKKYFLVVSLFTAIVSYVMITVLRAKPWFEISLFQVRRKEQIRDWQTYTDNSVYTVDEIKEYQKDHQPPGSLKIIKPDNVIQSVFLPFILVSFVVFVTVGLKYGSSTGFAIHNTGDVMKVVLQSIAYAAFLVFSVLSFAHQYIRDAGARAYKKKISHKFEKAIQLARKRDAFKELKKISLVTQKNVNSNPSSLIAFVVEVDGKHYVLVTDSEVDTIIIVKEFENPAMAEAYVWGENQQPQGSTEAHS